MLDASDFDAAENVSPFLSALVDAFCGLSRTAEVVSAMTEYVGMMSLVFRRHMNFEWTERTIQFVERSIVLFKKKSMICIRKVPSFRSAHAKVGRAWSLV